MYTKYSSLYISGQETQTNFLSTHAEDSWEEGRDAIHHEGDVWHSNRYVGGQILIIG